MKFVFGFVDKIPLVFFSFHGFMVVFVGLSVASLFSSAVTDFGNGFVDEFIHKHLAHRPQRWLLDLDGCRKDILSCWTFALLFFS